MAADDIKTKKRKGASDAAPKPKKQKKSDEAPAAAPSKPTKALKAVAAPSAAPTAKVKPSRKRAEDFFDDDNEEPVKPEEKPKKKAKKTKEPVAAVAPEVDEVAPKPKAKKGKEAKHPEPTEAPEVEPETVGDEGEDSAANGKKQKKPKESKKQQEAAVEEKVEVATEGANEDDEDLDDQTAALLAGFESDRDESDLEKEDENLDEDAPVPKLSKKDQKALQNIRRDSEPGVVYLGRIPHGFFEPQMKKYFSQFGDITRLRLSRNKKTGASKHYAFIEFRHGEVADIVAKTMHNYIMFGHILQCRVVPSEQVHPELFKGANERFKVDPRNKKAGNAMKQGASREAWAKRVERENKNRANKTSELEQEFGYTFDAPAVKPVSSVLGKALPAAEGAKQQLLEEGLHEEVTETVTAKKPKEASKSKVEAEPVEDGDAEDEQPAKVKVKKEKKRKSDVAAEQLEESIKTLKAKKAKNVVEEVKEPVVPEKKRKTKDTEESGAKPKKVKKTKA